MVALVNMGVVSKVLLYVCVAQFQFESKTLRFELRYAKALYLLQYLKV